MQTLGFIGVGNMGEALVRGLVQAGTARPQDVLVSARRKERVEELSRLYGVRGGSNSEVARQMTARASTRLRHSCPRSRCAGRCSPRGCWSRIEAG